MVRDALLDRLDTALLVSADADLGPAITNVHNLSVGKPAKVTQARRSATRTPRLLELSGPPVVFGAVGVVHFAAVDAVAEL